MRRFFSALVLLGSAFCRAEEASAAALQVSPVKVTLSKAASSTLVTLTNNENRTLRFQVEVMRWEEDETGEMKLAATKDLVFFPGFLVLEPKKSGKIRLGTDAAGALAEKSYRLMIEELPPPETDETPGAVSVLTRMSIPVFVDPKEPKKGAGVGASLAAGKLGITLENTGNVHLVPKSVRVLALDKSGATLFERTFQGWYVLAGARRIFEADIPKDACPRISSLVVEAVVDETITRRIEIDKPSCR